MGSITRSLDIETMNGKPDDCSRYGNCFWCIMCWLPLYSRQELGETYNVKPDDSFQNTSKFLTINASTHIKQCRYWFDQAYWDLIQAQRGTGNTLIFYILQCNSHVVMNDRQSQNVHVKLPQWHLHLQKHKMSNGIFLLSTYIWNCVSSVSVLILPMWLEVEIWEVFCGRQFQIFLG